MSCSPCMITQRFPSTCVLSTSHHPHPAPEMADSDLFLREASPFLWARHIGWSQTCSLTCAYLQSQLLWECFFFFSVYVVGRENGEDWMALQCARILRHPVQGLLTHSVLLLLAYLSFFFDFLLLHFSVFFSLTSLLHMNWVKQCLEYEMLLGNNHIMW